MRGNACLYVHVVCCLEAQPRRVHRAAAGLVRGGELLPLVLYVEADHVIILEEQLRRAVDGLVKHTVAARAGELNVQLHPQLQLRSARAELARLQAVLGAHAAAVAALVGALAVR